MAMDIKTIGRLRADSKKYQAFKALDHEQYRLKIRPTLRAWERMAYSSLLRITENREGTEFALVYSFAVVVIKGQNLSAIVDAIDRHHCDYIQEYDQSLGEKSDEPLAPFINTIAIYVETRDQMVLATDQALTDMAKSRSAQGH